MTCYHLYHKTAISTRSQNYNLWQRLCANLNPPNTHQNMNAIQTIGHLIILKQKVDLAIEMSMLMSDWVSLMANAAKI